MIDRSAQARTEMVHFRAGGIVFEWDEEKAKRNRAKHRVGFEEAATGRRRTLLVVHVSRAEHLRIISAREATRRERKAFEEEG